MVKLLVVVLALLSLSAFADGLIVSEDFSGGRLPENMLPHHNTIWAMKDGAACGQAVDMETIKRERAEGKKGHLGANPALNIKAPFHNATMQFDFRIEEEGRVVFVINGKRFSHMIQIEMGPESMKIIKLKDKKKRGSQHEILAEICSTLSPEEWHRLRVELVGPKVTAALDGKYTAEASDPRFDGDDKRDVTIRNAGPKVIWIDNVEIRKLPSIGK
jgi:hypothetical protein